jgi:hypothetical protein
MKSKQLTLLYKEGQKMKKAKKLSKKESKLIDKLFKALSGKGKYIID